MFVHGFGVWVALWENIGNDHESVYMQRACLTQSLLSMTHCMNMFIHECA